MKISKIEKDGRHLKIYIKMKWYQRYLSIAIVLDNMFEDNNESYLGTSIDETGKYIIATFLLRSKEDILPYLKVGENNE